MPRPRRAASSNPDGRAHRYGMGSALTTNPARPGIAPRGAESSVGERDRHVPRGRVRAVTGDGTTSTRRMIGTGLKKWTPTTRSGQPVAIASSRSDRRCVRREIGCRIEDLVDPGRRRSGRLVLDDRLDDERLAVGQLGDIVVNLILASASAAAPSESLPARTPRSSDFSMRAAPRSAPDSFGFEHDQHRARHVGTDFDDAEPIRPQPTTPYVRPGQARAIGAASVASGPLCSTFTLTSEQLGRGNVLPTRGVPWRRGPATPARSASAQHRSRPSVPTRRRYTSSWTSPQAKTPSTMSFVPRSDDEVAAVLQVELRTTRCSGCARWQRRRR